MKTCATVVVACAAGVASANVYSSSQTVDPWPDPAVANSELETLTIDFLGVPTNAAGDATITLDVLGDFNGTSEFLDVSVDGVSLGRLFNGVDGDDAFDFVGDNPGSTILSTSVTTSATISLALFLGLIADGALSFTFDPTEAQQPGQGVPAALTVTVSYPVPAPGALAAFGLAGLAVSRRRR